MSILFVIIGHLWNRGGASVALQNVGVHIFFVLSGYLITSLLQKEKETHGRINLLAFYRRRCFRIFPAAFTYIFVIALLRPASRTGLLYAVTYTVSYNLYKVPLVFFHLWSLSVEEQFYLLWPIALVLSFRYRARVAWLTMLLAAAFRLTLALSSSHAVAYLHYSFPGTMDSIAAGCLLAIYSQHLRERWGWMAESPAIVISVPLVAWILVTACWGGDLSTPAVRSVTAFWGTVPLLIALWIFLLVERRDWIFNNPVASVIGVLSYSLYLWQQPFTIEHRHPKLVAVCLLVACATASYLIIERPMLKLGSALQSAISPQSSPSKLVVTAQD